MCVFVVYFESFHAKNSKRRRKYNIVHTDMGTHTHMHTYLDASWEYNICIVVGESKLLMESQLVRESYANWLEFECSGYKTKIAGTHAIFTPPPLPPLLFRLIYHFIHLFI